MDLGVPESVAEAAIKDAIATGILEATTAIGAIVSALGSVLALIGGVFGIARANRIRQEAQPSEVAAAAAA